MTHPVFIGGFRSGTTLLINLLGLHPRVAPWFETKDLCEALRWLRVLREPASAAFEAEYAVPRQPAGFETAAVYERMCLEMAATFARMTGREGSGKAAHERYPLGHDCVRYSLAAGRAALAGWRAQTSGADYARGAAATGRLFRALGERHAQAMGRPLWINKTPEITRFAPELRAALGPCKVVYLVRDGLDVVSSAASLGWGEVEKLAFNWKGLLERTRAAMAECPADYLELRYEDLLARPAQELDRVLAFCGLQEVGEGVVERFTREGGGGCFDHSRIGGGRRLSAEEAATFERVAGDLQSALGYRVP